MVQFPQEKFQG